MAASIQMPCCGSSSSNLDYEFLLNGTPVSAMIFFVNNCQTFMDQCFWSEFIESESGISGKIPIRIWGIYDQKLKNWQLKKSDIFSFFCSKIAIYLSLGLQKGGPNYRRSLQPSKENIKHFKT